MDPASARNISYRFAPRRNNANRLLIVGIIRLVDKQYGFAGRAALEGILWIGVEKGPR
jgi:hypothetical protein